MTNTVVISACHYYYGLHPCVGERKEVGSVWIIKRGIIHSVIVANSDDLGHRKLQSGAEFVLSRCKRAEVQVTLTRVP